MMLTDKLARTHKMQQPQSTDKIYIAKWPGHFNYMSKASHILPSVLWRCWLDRKGMWPVKTEWWGIGVVICPERGADLHMGQLMPLPLTVSCFSKSRLVLPFWYRLTQDLKSACVLYMSAYYNWIFKVVTVSLPIECYARLATLAAIRCICVEFHQYVLST